MYCSYFENDGSYTNDLTGRAKEDIMLDFAYSLVTSGKNASNAFVREGLIKFWRQNQLQLTEFSEKKIKRYNCRRVSDEEDMTRIASVLKTMTESEDGRTDIVFGIVLGMSRHVVRIMRKNGLGKKDEPLSFEAAYHAFFDENTSKDLQRFRSDWSSAAAFARTFMKKDAFSLLLEEADLTNEDSLVRRTVPLIADIVFCNDDSFLWFPDKSRLKDDKRGIAKYNTDSDFYRLCMQEAHERLMYLRDTFMFACGLPEYGSYIGYTLSGFYSDCEAMRDAGDALLQGEMKVSPLSAEKPNAITKGPSDKNYMNYWFAKGALKCIYEYASSGIDIMIVARGADLSKRETELIVKEAFGLYELWTGDDKFSFTSKRDKEAVSEVIVRLWLVRCLEKQLSKFGRGKKSSAEKESSAGLKRVLKDYEQKNASLEKKLSAAEQNIKKAEASSSGEIKELRAEIARLKETISKKDDEIKAGENERKELLDLFMISDDAEEETRLEETPLTEAEFRAYINERKVLVWGLRDETARKFQEMFPELTFISSDRRLTRQQLEAYDVLLMATNYTNHGNFWAARDTAKAVGIAMAYLEKTANSPECLYRAFDIAAGSGAEKLHGERK